jgi:hypothetical protein
VKRDTLRREPFFANAEVWRQSAGGKCKGAEASGFVQEVSTVLIHRIFP